MDERLRFVARLLDGEKVAALCREFDISRKTRAELGRAQDPREAQAHAQRRSDSSHQYRSRGALPSRHGQPRPQRRAHAQGTTLSKPLQPNELWRALDSSTQKRSRDSRRIHSFAKRLMILVDHQEYAALSLHGHTQLSIIARAQTVAVVSSRASGWSASSRRRARYP
jgi:hypothetical protein